MEGRLCLLAVGVGITGLVTTDPPLGRPGGDWWLSVLVVEVATSCGLIC